MTFTRNTIVVLDWTRLGMGLLSEAREFLEVSTIHGLVHISTGKTTLVRVCWALIVITCIFFGTSLISDAFESWEKTPIITTVNTQPIGKVTFPEITICPPRGSDTALNVDLRTALTAELEEPAREELVVGALEELHRDGAEKFIRQQNLFSPLSVIQDMYSGGQQFDLSYIDPGMFYNDIWYPDIWTLDAKMNKEGSLSGQFATPGYGKNITEDTLLPSLKVVFTAFIPPQMFDPEIGDVTLVVDLDYFTDLKPVSYGDVPFGEGFEKITFETIDSTSTELKKSGEAKFIDTYPLDSEAGCSFSVTFYRYSLHQYLEEPHGGFNVNWYFEDGDGNKILEVDPIWKDVGHCADSWEDYDDEETPVAPLARWFNIFHLFISTSGLSVEEVWKIVRNVKLHQLWKDDSMECEEFEVDEYFTMKLGNLNDEDIARLLGDIDEGGVVDSQPSLSREDLTEAQWMTGFEMFSHLSYCPSDGDTQWADFYKDTLAKSPVRAIVEKVTSVMNKKSLEDEDITTERNIYNKLNTVLQFKAGTAVAGLSPTGQLEDKLESPLMSPLRPALLACLREGSCGQLGERMATVSQEEYRWANHPPHILDNEGRISPSAFIPFCAFAENMEVLGIRADNFSLPVCNVFYPR